MMNTIYDFICNHSINTAIVECYSEKNDKCIGIIKLRNENISFRLFETFEKYESSEIVQRTSTNKMLYALLKSNLQKQIRRQLPGAKDTAKVLLYLNPFEFLRRLPVIAIEDSEMCTDLSYIIWMMMAVSKGWKLREYKVSWILEFVHSLVKNNNASRLNNQCYFNHNEKLTITEVMESNHPQKGIIAGILVRTSYGGLKGDSIMIKRSCRHFKDLLLELPTLKIYSTFPPKVSSILQVEWYSADFHVFPHIISSLHRDNPKYSPQQIKKTIWKCASGINSRKIMHIDTETEEMWNIISMPYKSLCIANRNKILLTS